MFGLLYCFIVAPFHTLIYALDSMDFFFFFNFSPLFFPTLFVFMLPCFNSSLFVFFPSLLAFNTQLKMSVVFFYFLAYIFSFPFTFFPPFICLFYHFLLFFFWQHILNIWVYGNCYFPFFFISCSPFWDGLMEVCVTRVLLLELASIRDFV